MNDAKGVARELRLAREAAGLTREQAAEKMGISASLIDKVERGVVEPSEMYVKAAEVLTPAAGYWARLREDSRSDPVPGWFLPWQEHEQEASEIRNYEPLLVPGLLQTEGYARALLVDDERVASRMARQAVLDRADVRVVIDERVTTRKIGNATTMAEQLHHLATEDRAAVYVLPRDADPRPATLGSFVIATVDGTMIGYTDTPLRGFTVVDQGVDSAMRLWESLTTEALPRSLSQDLIMKAAEKWKTQVT